MTEDYTDAPSRTDWGRDDIPDRLHSVCANCIANCREKYQGFTEDEGTYHEDGFAVRCKYIPHDGCYLPDKLKLLKDHLSVKDWEEANSWRNPLLWAEKNLRDPDNNEPWRPWAHQIAPLMCSSPRKVYRFGRRNGKTILLAVEILWYLFTGGGMRDEKTGRPRENLTILAMAPMKSHIDNLFSRIRKFLVQSPHLADCVGRNVRGAPQLLAIRGQGGETGNQIIGFASGDSSGAQGLVARGQDADLIIVDEGAWVSENVMVDVINPMLLTKKTSRIIMSSTPSGTPGDYFERACVSMPTYKEFYVPASERPDWEDVKDQMRKEFAGNEDKWNREILAKFSQSEAGVYKKELIRAAQTDFEYGERPYNGTLAYTIGIDWNKEHGTEIAVIGTQKAPPFISWVVFAENIPKKDFTTPMGLDRVIALNRYWHPQWIYVDEGGDGSTCANMLQFHGRNSVGKNVLDARLATIVKAYNFGAKVEIQDHHGKMIKRPAKPFMVENSVRKLELGELRFPRSDLVLQKQFDNYVVSKRTPAGLPSYGVREPKWGDHRLDAVNLALIAVRLEMPSLTDAGLVPLVSGLAYVPYGVGTQIQRSPLPLVLTGRGLDKTEDKRQEPGENIVVQYQKVPFRQAGSENTKLRQQGLRKEGRTWRR